MTIGDGGQESTIVADQIQQVGGPNDLLVATGNVEITQGATRLLADRVELNRDTGEVVAQGKVVFFDGQDRLVGDRVDYNLKTGTGIVYNGSTSTAPYYHLSGEQMERVGEGVYEVRRGTFTTCEGDDPIWSFKFGSSTANLNDVFYGTGASFWVRNIPLIPFVPFFGAAIRRERQTGFLYPEVGNSSTKGLFLKIPFFWAISDSQDLTVALDTYTKRGVGVEGEYRYIMSERARGSASGFLIPEFLRDSQDRERLDIPLVRGFGSAKHDWQITPRLSFKFDANVTTDDQVYRDYGDRLGDRARQYAETNVFVSQRWDAFSLTANVLWYQDLTTPAATELQRTPEITFFGVRQPIPGLPGFLYESEASLTNFYRVVGDSGLRIDLHPRALLPHPDRRAVHRHAVRGRTPHVLQPARGRRARDQLRGDRGGHDLRSPHAPPGRGRLRGRDPRHARLRHERLGRPLGAPARHRAARHVPHDPGLRSEGQSPVRSRHRPDRPRHADHLLAHQSGQCQDGGAHGYRGGAVGGGALSRSRRSTTSTRRSRTDSPSGTCMGSSSSTPTPSCASGPTPPTICTAWGSAWRTRISRRATATWAVTVGSRYDTVAGANWVVGEVTARILPNVDAHVNTNWDVGEGTLVEGRVGIQWRFQCFSVMADYVYRKNNESQFRFAIGLLGIGQFGTSVGAGFGQ